MFTCFLVIISNQFCKGLGGENNRELSIFEKHFVRLVSCVSLHFDITYNRTINIRIIRHGPVCFLFPYIMIHFSAFILPALNSMVVDGSLLLSGTWEISVHVVSPKTLKPLE
jgi:hypothetical protein